MPQRHDLNPKLPRSSSSVSLNESPVSDEINYDSDISEDEHAIAEGDDDEEAVEDEQEEEEPDEGFEVEVSTLTGNTFSVMIQPQDTVEVLKTRIAFQEGISPADQNLVLEQGKLLDTSTSSSTLQELNISSNSKLTLVTNVSSGVPFKNTQGVVNDDGVQRSHLWDTPSSPGKGNGHSFRLAPTIKRNYNGNANGLNPPQSQSTSLRLPKILTNNNNINNNNNLDENENSVRKEKSLVKNSSLPERLDEREWMQSLFNKVVNNEEAEEDPLNAVFTAGVEDDDIDSTTGGLDSTLTSGYPPKSTRYGRKDFLPRSDEDGNILVVKGDDGVILIIQKNSGQTLQDSGNENDETYSIDLGVHTGRIPAMGRYYKDKHYNNTTGSRKIHRESDSVKDRIKENAVTLEKMKQVRRQMAQKNHLKTEQTPEKNLEFPKISGNGLASSSSSMASVKPRVDGNLAVPGVKIGHRSATGKRNNGMTSTRSINSSKMSLNRLIAEIYLQSKRKGYSFQPGQPPYTEQQLLRYVQLKVAILLDEQRKNKTEPCSKCIVDSDWNFKETAPYLTPTVVMNRYNRLSNSKSLDNDVEDELKSIMHVRRKSVIPSSNLSGMKKANDDEMEMQNQRRSSQIPHLISKDGKATAGYGGRTATTSSTFSRRSSSSVPPGVGSGAGGIPPIGGDVNAERDASSSKKGATRRSANQYVYFNGDNSLSCDRNGQSIYVGKRPSLKIHQKIYASNGTGNGRAVGYTSGRSRPGSSNKNAATKKGTVRCPVCKKKIGIACRYQCRCGLIFCSVHRYPESHECTFDYKTEGRNKIRQENPVIVAKKITEI